MSPKIRKSKKRDPNFEDQTSSCNKVPAGIYLLKFNNGNTTTMCEICSKLIKTPGRRHCRRCGVFIVNFEHISYRGLVFLLLTLNM